MTHIRLHDMKVKDDKETMSRVSKTTNKDKKFILCVIYEDIWYYQKVAIIVWNSCQLN